MYHFCCKYYSGCDTSQSKCSRLGKVKNAVWYFIDSYIEKQFDSYRPFNMSQTDADVLTVVDGYDTPNG